MGTVFFDEFLLQGGTLIGANPIEAVPT